MDDPDWWHRQAADFSVVLFRSDFALLSEKKHVKVPKKSMGLDNALSS
jgi:hypothetical protein